MIDRQKLLEDLHILIEYQKTLLESNSISGTNSTQFRLGLFIHWGKKNLQYFSLKVGSTINHFIPIIHSPIVSPYMYTALWRR